MTTFNAYALVGWGRGRKREKLVMQSCLLCLHVCLCLHQQWNKQAVVCYRCVSCSQTLSSLLQLIKALLVFRTLSPPVQMLCNVREVDFMLCLSPLRLALFHCVADCKIPITVQSITVCPVWLRFPTGLKEFMRGPTD